MTVKSWSFKGIFSDLSWFEFNWIQLFINYVSLHPTQHYCTTALLIKDPSISYQGHLIYENYLCMGCKLRTYWSIGWREIIGQNTLTVFSRANSFFSPYQIKGNDCFNALRWLPYFSKVKPYMSVCAAVSPSGLWYYRLYISNITTGAEHRPLAQIDGPCLVCSERLWNYRGASVSAAPNMQNTWFSQHFSPCELPGWAFWLKIQHCGKTEVFLPPNAFSPGRSEMVWFVMFKWYLKTISKSYPTIGWNRLIEKIYLAKSFSSAIYLLFANKKHFNLFAEAFP